MRTLVFPVSNQSLFSSCAANVVWRETDAIMIYVSLSVCCYQGWLCAYNVLFTYHTFNSSLHYIALNFFFFFAILLRVCVRETTNRVCFVFQQPCTSACLLISIMRKRKRGERNRNIRKNYDNLSNLAVLFIFKRKEYYLLSYCLFLDCMCVCVCCFIIFLNRIYVM